MGPPSFKRVEEAYHAALARPPGERDAFLREVCGGDRRATLTVGRPRVLFEGEFEEGGCCTSNYDIAPDGRFLMIEPSRDREPEVSHLVVVDNWFTELRQKLAR
jgi:hypothetical protein